jgi:hypothetical protein
MGELAFSEFFQVIHNFWRGPIGCADKLAHDFAIAIDNERLGVLKRAIQLIGFLPVPHRQQINIVITDELLVGSIVGILTHRQYGRIVPNQLLQLNQRGRLFDARLTPASPEVQHYGLAVELVEGDGSFGIGDCEVGGRTSDARRMGTIAGREHKHAEDCERRGQTLHLHIIMDSQPLAADRIWR